MISFFKKVRLKIGGLWWSSNLGASELEDDSTIDINFEKLKKLLTKLQQQALKNYQSSKTSMLTSNKLTDKVVRRTSTAGKTKINSGNSKHLKSCKSLETD